MASFQAKIGWKWPRKRLKYKLSFRFVPTQCVIENSKQIAKKFIETEKRRNAKIRGEMPRNGENKNYRSVRF